jgi:hypothetical protein
MFRIDSAIGPTVRNMVTIFSSEGLLVSRQTHNPLSAIHDCFLNTLIAEVKEDEIGVGGKYPHVLLVGIHSANKSFWHR